MISPNEMEHRGRCLNLAADVGGSAFEIVDRARTYYAFICGETDKGPIEAIRDNLAKLKVA